VRQSEAKTSNMIDRAIESEDTVVWAQRRHVERGPGESAHERQCNAHRKRNETAPVPAAEAPKRHYSKSALSEAGAAGSVLSVHSSASSTWRRRKV